MSFVADVVCGRYMVVADMICGRYRRFPDLLGKSFVNTHSNWKRILVKTESQDICYLCEELSDGCLPSCPRVHLSKVPVVV